MCAWRLGLKALAGSNRAVEIYHKSIPQVVERCTKRAIRFVMSLKRTLLTYYYDAIIAPTNMLRVGFSYFIHARGNILAKSAHVRTFGAVRTLGAHESDTLRMIFNEFRSLFKM
jgi:hypothetical protein